MCSLTRIFCRADLLRLQKERENEGQKEGKAGERDLSEGPSLGGDILTIKKEFEEGEGDAGHAGAMPVCLHLSICPLSLRGREAGRERDAHSLTHSLTHALSHTHSLTHSHSLSLSLTCRRSSTHLTRSCMSLRALNTLQHFCRLQYNPRSQNQRVGKPTANVVQTISEFVVAEARALECVVLQHVL